MKLTEELITGLVQHLSVMVNQSIPSLSIPDINCNLPFKRLDFIAEVETALKHPLPSLVAPDAKANLVQMLTDHSIPLPRDPTLSTLLEKLCATLIEPQCNQPTFIIHHPECMSPLSKSFDHPTIRGQRVAARAELFVQGQEVANMYEEENSPVEQRRKFLQQLQQQREREEVDHSSIDEQYLEALEWGLPPVGGWGCGMERLCMVLTGTSRIGDVLSFGTLRNVVAKSQKSREHVRSQNG